jgi:hypothetical protein
MTPTLPEVQRMEERMRSDDFIEANSQQLFLREDSNIQTRTVTWGVILNITTRRG